MKLIKYKDINPTIFQKYHFDYNTFLRECSSCNMYILEYNDEYLELYEYENSIEVYVSRCIKELDEIVPFIESKFDKEIYYCISIDNVCLKRIVKQIGYGCPQLSVKSENGNIYKFPKLILKKNCNDKHNVTKLVNDIEKSFNKIENLKFSKEDLNYFKSLLSLQYESGGEIKKINKELYKINMKSVIEGNETDIDLTPTPYNFHTHPSSVYNEKGNKTFVAWFSGVDIKYIIGNIPYSLKEHFLITVEGIYRLRVTPQFKNAYLELNERQQNRITDKLYHLFANLEDKRVVYKEKNILKINSETIKSFNDFFVTINSLNSSHFPRYFDDKNFLIFDLTFKLWENF